MRIAVWTRCGLGWGIFLCGSRRKPVFLFRGLGSCGIRIERAQSPSSPAGHEIARACVRIATAQPVGQFHERPEKGGAVIVDQFDQPGVFLAHQWEGKPITREHGGPVRMLVPKLYLWKSAKWLRRIHFTIGDHPGFWETRGYNNNADPWLEERYS